MHMHTLLCEGMIHATSQHAKAAVDAVVIAAQK